MKRIIMRGILLQDHVAHTRCLTQITFALQQGCLPIGIIRGDAGFGNAFHGSRWTVFSVFHDSPVNQVAAVTPARTTCRMQSAGILNWFTRPVDLKIY
jgi:hypothetical protein